MTSRSIVRGVVWVVAILFMMPKLSDAYHQFWAWRMTANDPSAREAYLTFMEVDLAITAVIAIVATYVGSEARCAQFLSGSHAA